MKKVFPFVLLFAVVSAIFGILFLVMRTDALPASIRSFDWRKAIGTTPDMPIEVEAV